jgi:MFS family permease
MTRDLRLLAFSLFLWGVGEGLFLYLQPIYLTQLGADPLQVGFVLSLAGAAMTVTHIPAGALADRLGRKSLMSAAWIFGALACFLMFLASSLWLFVAALILYSLTGFVMSPMSSYVTEARGPWSVGRALTTVSASFNAGAVIGPFAGGLLAARVGIRPLFGIAAVLFVFSTVAMVLLGEQPVEPSHAEGRYRSLFSNRTAARILIVTFLAILAMTLSWPLTPLFMSEVQGLAVAQIGALGSFFSLGIVILNLTLGVSPPRRGSMIGQGLVAGSVVLLWKGMSFPAYAAGYFLAGGSRTARSLLSAQVERVVERRQLGLAFGVVETVASSSLILAPLLAGLLYKNNPAAPYPVGLALIAGSLALSAWLLPADRAAPAPVRHTLEIER